MYKFEKYNPEKRSALLNEILKYFDIRELVSPMVYKIYGNRAWRFFDTEALEVLLWIRIKLNKAITINNWHYGGSLSQRGLRTNLGSIFKKMFERGRLYLSGHIFGKAFDFDVEGMTAEEVRDWIWKNQKTLPHKVRLEWKKNGKPITWVHMDMMSEPILPKVYKFNV
jgi:hypothetical protein